MSGHLVVVDVQRVFADPASPWAVPRFDAIVGPVRRLVDAFGDAVTFTRFVAPAEPAGAWVDYYARWPFALVAPDDPLYALDARFDGVRAGADGTAGASPCRAAASAVEVGTLDATTFGKWGPALAARMGAAKELVVCGVSTDCCVLSTVLPAADAGVRVRVAADACAGATDADHERALDAMRLYAPLVDVTTTDGLLG